MDRSHFGSREKSKSEGFLAEVKGILQEVLKMGTKTFCQIDGCKNIAKFALFKTLPNGEKVWLNVCTEHELEIARENIERAGGYVKK